MDWLTMINWPTTKETNNERTNVRSTIEDRLRNTGVLSAIRRAVLEDMEHHNEQTTTQRGDGIAGPNDGGEKPFSDDV